MTVPDQSTLSGGAQGRVVAFRVLGPLTAIDDGEFVGLGEPKQRMVLATLLTRPNQAVSIDALLKAVWGDRPPASARDTVHGYISELGHLLDGAITRVGAGYVIEVDEERLDSLRFEGLVSVGREVLAEDPSAALDHLTKALGLWSGLAFEDLRDQPGLTDEIERLEELRLGAIEDRIEADLAIGGHEEVVDDLESLVREYPYRERLRGQLMLALYRADRKPDALRVYQQTQRQLIEELGVDPSPALQSLQQQILDQDPALDTQVHAKAAETVLFFIDLEDSTPLWESDPEAMKPAIARFEQVIDEAVDSAGGEVFKSTGDGKLATMPAVAAAADAAEAFVRSMAAEDWGQLGELRARVAIDVGETEARAGDHFGPTMNRAGRLLSVGHGGQILLSAPANSFLADQRKTIDLGEHRLKGVGRPQRIFQLMVDSLDNEFPPLRLHSGVTPLTRSGFGRAIRGFELREEIGAGDFGVVYRAFQTSVGREVAIKVIRPEYASQPVFVKRFEAEAQFVAQLEHPHIVSLYDYWRDPDGAYVVMRYLRGGSLQHSLRRGPWNETEALRLLEQIGGALSYSHRQGVVHRDLKPANVLLDPDGNAYLSDFGIATRQADPAGDVLASSPVYVAPEERRGDPLTPQSDIFGLGVLTFELLTGVRPVFDGGLPSVLQARPALSPAIDDVLRKATATEPELRHERVEDFLRELRQAIGIDTVGAATSTAEAVMVEAVTAAPPRNPYKGLRAFNETDAADFFGREGLIELLAGDMERTRLIAVVGPSGSGKSSLVKAGLIPALRSGAVSGSREWLFTDMFPGSYPFEELEAALLRVAIGDPGRLIDELSADERGLLRVSKQILPHDDSQLVLVIDQFEELFSMVYDESVRKLFMDSLIHAVNDERSRLRVVLTLRADFFHRPLEYKAFGDLLQTGMMSITPPANEQLAQAIVQPARNAGLELEPGLANEIVMDVAGQPGALPLMQYALSELYRHREGNVLTAAGYRAAGGVGGAVGNRAEEIYESLDDTGRDAARQLFLRLVTVDDDAVDTRRRVAQTELSGLDVDQKALDGVVQEYGANRLLGFDRDPHSRGPTVEVAHEALLKEWERLRAWIDEKREDIVLHRRLAVAIIEWQDADRDPSFLLSGGRLVQFESWAATTELVLTNVERDFLEVSRGHEDRLEATARRRRLAVAASLAAVVLAAAIFGGVAWLNANRAQTAEEQVAQEQQAVAELQLQLETDGGIIDSPVGQITWAHTSGDEDSLPSILSFGSPVEAPAILGIPSGYAAVDVARDFSTGVVDRFRYRTSRDGLEWQDQPLPFDVTGRAAALSAAGDQYWIVTAGTAEIWVSSDGLEWEPGPLLPDEVREELPGPFEGEPARVYEAIGDVWLSSSTGLWVLRDGAWVAFTGDAMVAPQIDGISYGGFAGQPVSNGVTTLVPWNYMGSFPVEEILGIEEDRYDFIAAYWDPQRGGLIVEGYTGSGGFPQPLATWQIEATETGALLLDAESGEVVHEVTGSIEGMSAQEFAEAVKFVLPQQAIAAIGDDGSLSRIVPPWSAATGFASTSIVASGNTFLAFVSEEAFEIADFSVEWWSSIDEGETWTSLGVPGFIAESEQFFFGTVQTIGDLFFAQVEGNEGPEWWASEDAVTWERIADIPTWGQIHQLERYWVFSGGDLRFVMMISTNGTDWTPIDTSTMAIPAGAGALGAAVVGNTMFFGLSEDFGPPSAEGGPRDIWVLTLES